MSKDFLIKILLYGFKGALSFIKEVWLTRTLKSAAKITSGQTFTINIVPALKVNLKNGQIKIVFYLWLKKPKNFVIA